MKYSLISKNAINANLKKVQFIKVQEDGDFCGWIIIAMNENEELFYDSPDYFEEILNDELYDSFENFKEIENDDLGSIYVHNLGFERLVKIDRSKNDNIDNTTYATNPSSIEVDFNEWYKFNIENNLLDNYVNAKVFNLVYRFPFLSIIFGDLTSWIMRYARSDEETIKLLFESGDVLPAMVTSINPVKVAAMTNLTKGFGSYPAIQIATYENWKLNKYRVEVGDKLPVSTLYIDNTDGKKYWKGFYFFPVRFATVDKNKIFEKVYSIPEEDWDLLKEKLKQIKNPQREGLYKIDIEDSDW